jgi:hypothetical protein
MTASIQTHSLIGMKSIPPTKYMSYTHERFLPSSGYGPGPGVGPPFIGGQHRGGPVSQVKCRTHGQYFYDRLT